MKLAALMLEKQGYRVLAANTPDESPHMAQKHAGPLQRLLADVAMPEMNGWDLGKNRLELYPGMNRLFMSGDTANVIAHHGVLEEGIHFIQKLVPITDLAIKVREALDAQGV